MLDTKKLYDNYVIGCYTKTPLVITKGKGSYVWDSTGKKYLDLFPGWGVNGLGHCPPAVVKAIKKQAATLIHVPNNFYNELQGKLAELLIKHSLPGKCFFSNSGAEANEGAIKLARRYGDATRRFEIVTALKSFHGRTLTTVSATGQPKYQKGFGPLIPGFKHIPFGDINALNEAITPKTIALMIEPIQGEGGINIALKEYWQQVTNLCQEKSLLLILDEVQTGIGRTGKMFAYQNYDLSPDIITLAKALGGGFPIGGMIVKEKYADVLVPGTHASTFGGNPLACAAAIAAIETIEKKHLLARTEKLGKYFRKQLQKLKKEFPQLVKEIRGQGMMWGLELNIPGADIVNECLENGLLINCTQNTTIRFLPALTVTKQQLKAGIEILREVLKSK